MSLTVPKNPRPVGSASDWLAGGEEGLGAAGAAAEGGGEDGIGAAGGGEDGLAVEGAEGLAAAGGVTGADD